MGRPPLTPRPMAPHPARSGPAAALSHTCAVAQLAPPPVTNTSPVSGGAEANTAHNPASGPTNLVPRAYIAGAKPASSGPAVGGPSDTYTITATNNGPSD